MNLVFASNPTRNNIKCLLVFFYYFFFFFFFFGGGGGQNLALCVFSTERYSKGIFFAQVRSMNPLHHSAWIQTYTRKRNYTYHSEPMLYCHSIVLCPMCWGGVNQTGAQTHLHMTGRQQGYTTLWVHGMEKGTPFQCFAYTWMTGYHTITPEYSSFCQIKHFLFLFCNKSMNWP